MTVGLRYRGSHIFAARRIASVVLATAILSVSPSVRLSHADNVSNDGT